MVIRDSTLSNPNVQNDYQSNPVFQIKVRGLENDLEQVNTNTKKDKDKKIYVGKIVTGTELNGKKNYTGNVTSIKKNEKGIISYIEILDNKSHKKIKIDYSTCTLEDSQDNIEGNSDNYQIDVAHESKKFILNFEEFKKYF